MLQNNVQAYIIPSEDAHQSEYIAAFDERRKFISGFTGSAGLAVVTQSAAALWTDGRYFLQASQELDSNWILQKSGMPGVPSKEDWLIKVLPPRSRIGLDPTLISVADARSFSEAMHKAGHSMAPLPHNLIDSMWTDRPNPPSGNVFLLHVEYSGKSSSEKIDELKELIQQKSCIWGFVVTALDEIAWLFNLRGSDINYNPVFFSYAVVTKTEVFLYIDERKLEELAKDALSKTNVNIRPYESIFQDLRNFGEKAAASTPIEKLWVDGRCSLALQDAWGGSDRVERHRSPIQSAKSIKNAAEIQGFRNCHIRDASALCEFFSWLEDELVVKGNNSLTEVEAADKLEQLRSKLHNYMGLSFSTISSSGSNGSIIHYKPTPGHCKVIDVNKIYLCDSGAQYRDGTTDVTRTMHFGEPTDFEKEAFTRVLKGHIQIDMTVFPKGTTGYILDVISRMALWKGGLDFRHGTGHGVGAFLNVHEGPHGIGTRIAYNDVPMESGMTITNEPGYYEDGEFGIRIENIMIVKDIKTAKNFGGTGYLGFEHVTMVPIQTKMILRQLLDRDEISWVNSYNQKCYDSVSPLLTGKTMALAWLKRETAPM